MTLEDIGKEIDTAYRPEIRARREKQIIVAEDDRLWGCA
jgi:hypothetical protein